MTPKQRVLAALNHQEPDRVPLDLGGWVTTMSVVTYNKLLKLLGIEREGEVFDWLRQNVWPEDDVLERLGVDTRYVHPGNPHSWTFNPVQRDDGLYVVDEWGCGFIKTPTTLYYNLIDCPLKQAKIEDIDAYENWPDPRDPGLAAGVAERAKMLADQGEYAVIGNFAWETWYERAWKLRGMQEFYMDMGLNRDFIHAILDKTVDIHLEFLDHMLTECGQYLDVIIQGGDLGSQQTTLMSVKDYEEFIKPRQKKVMDFIRTKTNAKIFWHSCGAVSSLVPHFIDVGIDILNPVQVRANNMDAEVLKAEYGKDIAFWGGVDSQHVLPTGSVSDVENEVKHLLKHMAPGGGLVVCSVHNLQADVPPENVLALYDSVAKWGQYPLSRDL